MKPVTRWSINSHVAVNLPTVIVIPAGVLALRRMHREAVIGVAVYGDVSERHPRQVAEKIRDNLADAQAISQAEFLGGSRGYETSIEVSEENLRRHGAHIYQGCRGSANRQP